jgi:hypothetical protein
MGEVYYLVVMRSGLEPESFGSYSSEGEMDSEARRIHKHEMNEDDNIFWLIIEDGEPLMGTYTNGFFEMS